MIEDLYPLQYDGKLWNEEDCDILFASYYLSRSLLNSKCGLYISEGYWVFPDGKILRFF
jgi:hypothetical protein